MKARAASPPHEKLARRLTAILRRLNEGCRLVPSDLAAELKVSLRTIQRDLARFEGLGLRRVEDGYELEPTRLGQLTFGDLEAFARRAGIAGLFPTLRDGLNWSRDGRASDGVRVQGHEYEDLRGRRSDFLALQRAVVERLRVGFCFEDVVPRKVYDGVEPYGLINLKGIWYLAARHAGRTKTFSFSRIASLLVSGDYFVHDAAIAERIAAEPGAWFQDQGRRVIIEVAPPAASYFRRRRLIVHQEILADRKDGSLLVCAKVGHEQQILPIVRYWIPHVRIVEPVEMQAQLESQLLAYLGSRRLEVDSSSDPTPGLATDSCKRPTPIPAPRSSTHPEPKDPHAPERSPV